MPLLLGNLKKLATILLEFGGPAQQIPHSVFKVVLRAVWIKKNMTTTELHIPGATSRRKPPKRAAAEVLRNAAKCPETLDHAVNSRLDDISEHRMTSRRRPSRLSRLPELAPADNPSQRHKPFVGLDMSSSAVSHEETDFAQREETRNEMAKLTVYVMNAILLIMAFPVGFGMLVFNILGGENLRTTAHVIALTGFAIGLTGGAFGSDFLFSI
jgi:hypothetical protein